LSGGASAAYLVNMERRLPQPCKDELGLAAIGPNIKLLDLPPKYSSSPKSENETIYMIQDLILIENSSISYDLWLKEIV
jgi:hypothetical protein